MRPMHTMNTVCTRNEHRSCNGQSSILNRPVADRPGEIGRHFGFNRGFDTNFLSPHRMHWNGREKYIRQSLNICAHSNPFRSNSRSRSRTDETLNEYPLCRASLFISERYWKWGMYQGLYDSTIHHRAQSQKKYPWHPWSHLHPTASARSVQTDEVCQKFEFVSHLIVNVRNCQCTWLILCTLYLLTWLCHNLC